MTCQHFRWKLHQIPIKIDDLLTLLLKTSSNSHKNWWLPDTFAENSLNFATFPPADRCVKLVKQLNSVLRWFIFLHPFFDLNDICALNWYQLALDIFLQRDFPHMNQLEIVFEKWIISVLRTVAYKTFYIKLLRINNLL